VVSVAAPNTIAAVGLSMEGLDGLEAILHESGIADGQAEDALWAVLEVAHGLREGAEDGRLYPSLRDHLVAELGLTDQQVELIVDLAHLLAYSLNPTGEMGPPAIGYPGARVGGVGTAR
jgi:hypothetical protein